MRKPDIQYYNAFKINCQLYILNYVDNLKKTEYL